MLHFPKLLLKIVHNLLRQEVFLQKNLTSKDFALCSFNFISACLYDVEAGDLQH